MQFDFNLGANQSMPINVAGRFFKYRSGIGMIRVKMSKGGFVDLLPGQGVWNVDYSDLSIVDKSGAANSGVILAGAFDFHDDRITGTVDVVDGGRTRTLANSAFMAGTSSAALAANVSFTQLWNLSTTKRLMVESVAVLSTGSAGLIQLRMSAVKLALNETTSPTSKMSGGAASVAAIACKGTAAAANDPLLTGAAVTANKTETIKLVEPIVLLPGYGLSVNGQVNQDIITYFEFFEETI